MRRNFYNQSEIDEWEDGLDVPMINPRFIEKGHSQHWNKNLHKWEITKVTGGRNKSTP